MRLHLEKGAVLAGSQELADYPLIMTRWEGAETLAYQPLLYAREAEQIASTGAGTIDGQGAPWWQAQRARTLAHPRPRLIAFAHCQSVAIRGVQLINSPSGTVHPFACATVNIAGVNILNPADSPNTDSVDPESCTDVVITDCRISAGDDCIAIKAGVQGSKYRQPCERLAIRRRRLECGHGAVVMGNEMSGGVRDVELTDCEFVGTDRGFRFKTRRGRGGFIEHFRAARVLMERVGTPIAINMYYEYTGADGRSPEVQDRGPRPVTPSTPWIRHLSFTQVTARQAGCAAAFVLGLPEMPVEGLHFDDVHITMADAAAPDPPEMAVGIERVSRQGFQCANVTGLRLNKVTVTNQLGEAFTPERLPG